MSVTSPQLRLENIFLENGNIKPADLIAATVSQGSACLTGCWRKEIECSRWTKEAGINCILKKEINSLNMWYTSNIWCLRDCNDNAECQVKTTASGCSSAPDTPFFKWKCFADLSAAISDIGILNSKQHGSVWMRHIALNTAGLQLYNNPAGVFTKIY